MVTSVQQHPPVVPPWQSSVSQVYTSLGLFGFLGIFVFTLLLYFRIFFKQVLSENRLQCFWHFDTQELIWQAYILFFIFACVGMMACFYAWQSPFFLQEARHHPLMRKTTVAVAAAYMEMRPVPKWDPVLYGQNIWVLLKQSMTNSEKRWMSQCLSTQGIDWATALLTQSCCDTCLHGTLIQMDLMGFHYTVLLLGNRWKKEKKHSGLISRWSIITRAWCLTSHESE